MQENNKRTTELMRGKTKPFDIEELIIMNASIPKNGFVIISQESGQEIATIFDKRFILGRAEEGVKELLIDLSPFGAHRQGVSRLHILIQKTETGYEISDMETINGTWLNEQEVVPNRFYPVSSGDSIRMGKMYISVFFLTKDS
jgi:hypothetical protein